MKVHIHEAASVESSATIASGVRIWAHAHVRENANIGENVIVGEGVYIGPGVQVGRDTKIQNGAMLYEPANIGSGVFIGPQVVFTNDTVPRAINPNGAQKTAQDWEISGVRVSVGASVGANCVCVAPVSIGEWAMIGAGSVVTRDVPNFALVIGVPAKQIGWICKCGFRLPGNFQKFTCTSCYTLFEMSDGTVREVVAS